LGSLSASPKLFPEEDAMGGGEICIHRR